MENKQEYLCYKCKNCFRIKAKYSWRKDSAEIMKCLISKYRVANHDEDKTNLKFDFYNITECSHFSEKKEI